MREVDQQLFAAAREGLLEGVESALSLGADVNATDPEGLTPLRAARQTRSANRDVLLRLLQAAADPNRYPPGEIAPLSIYVQETDLELIETAIAAGADVNAQAALSGWTPLHWAALFNNEGALRLLVKAGADIDRQDKHGFTPLILSTLLIRHASVAGLLDLGADVHIRDVRGSTALCVAVSGAPMRMRPKLFDYPPLSPMHKTAEDMLDLVVELLLLAESDPDV